MFIDKNPFMQTKVLSSAVILLLLFMIAATVQSCYQKSFKVSEESQQAAADPGKFIREQQQKYFIMRSGTDAYHMQDIVTDSNGIALTCKLGRVGPEHGAYLSPDRMNRMTYNTSSESGVLDEVHLFVTGQLLPAYNSTITVPYDRISKIDILEPGKSRVSAGIMLGAAGIIIAGLWLLVAAIVTMFSKEFEVLTQI